MSPASTMIPAAARKAVLTAADDLLYARGVHGVTMADIRDRSGVSLRRLYSLFPSKDDLVASWLHDRHESWMAGFTHEVDLARAAGVEPVDAVFEALAAWMDATDYRGCGFINTHAEQGDLRPQHREIIRRHKRELAAYLTTQLRAGGAIAVLLDGAIVQASIFASPDPIHRAREAARVLTKEESHG